MKRKTHQSEVAVLSTLLAEFKQWLESRDSLGCFPARTFVKAGTTMYWVNKDGVVKEKT